MQVSGTEESSVKRGAVMMRDEYPLDEVNFYETESF
jgi:hypothetical protein